MKVATKSQARQAAKTDRGPHTATFPGGIVMRFTIPDSSRLARSGRLPDRLKKVALVCAGHPGGADGYMADLAFRAVANGTFEETVTEAIATGLEMTAWLVSEMLVEPAFTPEEIDEGALSEPVIRMLLDFAERKRDTDAAGKKLPIITLESMATFRAGNGGPESAGTGAAAADDGGDAVPDDDGDPV